MEDNKPHPSPDRGVEIDGVGRLIGSRVFDNLGNQIPMVRDIEYTHRVGEPPIVRVTCYASKINASGVVEMVMCPWCKLKRDAMRLYESIPRRYRRYALRIERPIDQFVKAITKHRFGFAVLYDGSLCITENGGCDDPFFAPRFPLSYGAYRRRAEWRGQC